MSYQKAEVVYDLTYRFANKYLSKGDRTVDQMIQSARSGKQNIAEGSKAALTSKETEIKLTNVARASLEELLVELVPKMLAVSFQLKRFHHVAKKSRYENVC
jgi:four helix bundle protein